MNFSYKK